MTATKLYRIARKLYLLNIPILPRLVYRMIYFINNSHIHYETEIGEGTKTAYGGISVVIHKRSKIRSNCVIESCVTIGGKSEKKGVPRIGNNVFIGTGAKILGDIEVGDNSIIGANAVVIKDVPKNSIAAGVPAKVIRENIDINKETNLKRIVSS